MDEYKRRRRRSRAVMSMFLDSLGGSIDNVDVATFDSDGTDLKALVVGIEPIQAGSGEPSSDNIRPISGRTSATVTRTGKNLCSSFANAYVHKGTSDSVYLTGTGTTLFFECVSGVTYTVSGISTNRGNFAVFDSMPVSGARTTDDGTFTVGTTATFTPTKSGVCAVYVNNALVDASTAQIELGSTATAYEPYAGNNYTIQFGQTVYGGQLDVTTGMLAVDRAMVDMGTLAWHYTTNWNGAPAFYSDVFSDCADVTVNGVNTICSTFKAISGNDLWRGTTLTSIIALPSSKRLYVRDTRYSTDADFKAAVSGQTALYPLATPIVYDLTPTEVTTLLGTNNVWCDSGKIIHLEY